MSDEPGDDADGPVDDAGDELVDAAIELAGRWLDEGQRLRSRRERQLADRLDGVLADPAGVAFTMRFVDRVARHRDDRLAAAQLAALVSDGAIPAFLGRADRLLLRAGAVLGRVLPQVVVPLARRRLRAIVGHLVVDADTAALHAHLAERRTERFDLNVNLLGEMVLGEAEAGRRVEATLGLIDDPAVDYVSIKVSGIASHLDLWSFDHTVDRIAERLRVVFARAAALPAATFVNLDMEEYRDLELTIAAFTRVLDEPRFEHLDAGIVLQAYLPDAHDALRRVVRWANARHERAGGVIKIRLVKGANLAMERVDAALHGWQQAPYTSKADVDASYERCLDWVFTADRLHGVRIGVASHNLFDVAWAHLLAERRGVSDRIDVEMLQGIAPGHARSVRDDTGSMLLYTPVVGRTDFDVAISYLFRRLEENAAAENFLRHLTGLWTGHHQFGVLADRFGQSVARRWQIDTGPRRALSPARPSDRFVNEPDSDPALAATRSWIERLRTERPGALRAQLTTSVGDVDAAFVAARAAQPRWSERPTAERRAVLHRVADELSRRRGELIVTMAHEARKVFAEADPEVSEAIDFARWYGDRAPELDRIEHARFEPLGVVAVVPPWNFPVAIPAGGVLAALAAGNTVILKPAPETPRCAEVVAEACWSAGVPRDVLQMVRTPDDDVGRRLVTGADGVVFTGSFETASMFRRWRPALALFAETSGKNAMVVTPQADHDLAASDLVRSAFGHSGQKCSAASLGIVVGDLAEDRRFLAKVVDAAASLRVGIAAEPGTTMGPLIGPASGLLRDALTGLDAGEEWLLEPRRLDDDGALWTPGIKVGVQPGSWFHLTECFGPVLGLMRAHDLDHALALQNQVDFGLTGGIHSLDDDEIEYWLDRVEVGNAYVNRHTTGAIVQRQPFGGWKGSVIGPGAKAGGPDQLLQLGRMVPRDPADPVAAPDVYLAAAARSDERWMADHYGVVHDATALFCEANVLRYRPRPTVWIRAASDAVPARLARAVAAADRAGCAAQVSVAPGCSVVDAVGRRSSGPPVVEDDAAFERRFTSMRWGRVRTVGTVAEGLHEAAHRADVSVIDAEVTADGRVELRWYLREQAVSRTLHRFGNIVAQRPGCSL